MTVDSTTVASWAIHAESTVSWEMRAERQGEMKTGAIIITSNDKISVDSESEWMCLMPVNVRMLMKGQAVEMRVGNFMWDSLVLRHLVKTSAMIQI